MAKPDHTAPARSAAAQRSHRKPTNPLGRPYWMFDPSAGSAHQIAATCAALTTGVHTLARILTNNEAFRVLQESCSPNDPTQTPYGTEVTEGLFAALYMLSEQAALACSEMWERAEEEEGGKGSGGD